MALFRRFFYKKGPDRLVEISERVYVFDSCHSSDVMREVEIKVYLDGIVAQLHDHFPSASFMVFNFREGEQRSHITDVLSQCDMTVMDYPRQYANCLVLPLEMIHHFLRSSESWLSQQGQQDVLLMHCETSSWPVLAFLLSGLLLYKRQYQGEQKTLEMVYKQAPIELLRLSSPLNPQASQLRYLQYISRRNLGSDWPPVDIPLLLDCLILRDLPCFEGGKGCRPVLRVYGQDPNARANRSSMLLFSTLKIKKHARLYQQEECILVKINIQCHVQGDVVLECIHLHDDLVREEIVFRIMFHTAFVRADILLVHCDEMDILWDAKNYFPKEFKAEVLFSSVDALVPIITTATISEDENASACPAYVPSSPPPPPPPPPLPYMSIALSSLPKASPSLPSRTAPPPPLPCIHIDFRRAYNTEIMLKKVKMPLPDMMAAVLAMDDTVLDIDQIDNLIKLCPTKEEMELLKSYTGDKKILGKCEQYFLGLMKVPRVESKLRVFSFKIQFGTQITEFKKSLNAVNSACEEVRTSQKLKGIMKNILYLGNILNQGTARGAAMGFKLDSLLKLSDTRGANSKMTLMHYLCKVLASKASVLLDFHKDLESLESASKIQSLAEEMQAIINGLEKLNQELTASESDGPVSDVFHKTLKHFISIAETEVATVSSLYAVVGNNADQLAYYFAEEPEDCPFEQVTATLLTFVRLFKKAHEENIKQAELEKKKAAKEGEMGAQRPAPPPMRGGAPQFSSVDALVPITTTAIISEDENDAYIITPPEDDTEVEEIYGDVIDGTDDKRGSDSFVVVDKSSNDSEATSVLHSSQAAASPPPFSEKETGPPAIKTISLKPLYWVKVTRALEGSLWDELQRHGEAHTAPEFDVSEIKSLFSAIVQKPGGRRKPEKVQLFDLRRAHNTEIMLTKVKMPLPDMMAAVLAMDDTVLDIDQIENLIKFCPTKEEMELLKNYIGDKTNLGKCEQYFLELMKVPRVESKLRVFSFKILFGTQIIELKKCLNAVNSACEEVRTSQKLKEIMKKILYLGNTLNQGTARGAAVGFKLDSLLKLGDIRAANRKMTLTHYLCKVIASKASVLLDFHKDLESLESASKIQLRMLAEEMEAIISGLEKLNQELTASESDGPVSDVFRKTLKDFISIAKTEVATVSSLYAVVGNNVDQLAYYFGEEPRRCPFEKVTATLLTFIRLFKKTHKENIKQAELEKKKGAKEGELGAQLPPMRGGAQPSLKPLYWFKITRALEESLWYDLQRHGESLTQSAPEFDVSEIETLFSASSEARGRECAITSLPLPENFAKPLPPLPPHPPPPPPMCVGAQPPPPPPPHPSPPPSSQQTKQK